MKVSKSLGETINIGSGDEISIKNLIKVIKEIFKKKMEIDYDKKDLDPKKVKFKIIVQIILKLKKLLIGNQNTKVKKV